ncbi:MAG: hypothetical protein CMO26_01055 [Thiotrichales bacterium]|nr:hypothetical protein [Thiotrichales bacterium]
MVKFSIMTALDPNAPVTDVVDVAKATEEAGFDTLWLWDSWASKDVNIGLALAAQHTRTLKLATGVSPTPLRHSALLVNSIATVDDISDGRAILGIGCGGQATVGRLGVRKARIAEFRSEMQLIRFLLAGGQVDEDGKLYQIESVSRPVPVYTAVWGPRMQTVSGELADGVIIMGPEQPAVFADKMARVRAGASDAGRNPDEVKLVLQVTGAYADDPTPFIDKYKSLAIHHMQRLGYEKEYPQEFAPLFDRVRQHVENIAMPEGKSPGTELIPDEFVKHAMMVGTEEECVERMRSLIAIEPDEIVFSIGYATVADIEKFANLVRKSVAA